MCVAVGVCDIPIFYCVSALAPVDSKAEAVNEETVNIKSCKRKKPGLNIPLPRI